MLRDFDMLLVAKIGPYGTTAHYSIPWSEVVDNVVDLQRRDVLAQFGFFGVSPDFYASKLFISPRFKVIDEKEFVQLQRTKFCFVHVFREYVLPSEYCQQIRDLATERGVEMEEE